ncbi:YfjI family protein [Atlantibacter hermannii]|uniref:YfjI family protein n=1 Tax=Atlantibacter hermannii TaxID=565 RepID=UPI002FFA4F5E
MLNGNMKYPIRPWDETLTESKMMAPSRKIAEETGYPVDLFPPVLRDVIVALFRDIDAPIELISGTVLSAVSLACQPFIDIQFPDGRVKPCSLYNIILANSGERKSTIFSLIMKPFFDFENKDNYVRKEKMAEYNTAVEVWNIRRKSIIKGINKKIANGEDYASEQNDLKILNMTKPITPRKMKLTYTDTTPEAMQRGLYDNIPWAGLISDEASVFFEGRAKNNLGFLNELWDGGRIDVERRSENSFVVDDARFTMLLMVQHDIFKQYFKDHGGKAAGSGFLSRFLISFIPPTQVRRLSSRNDVYSSELNNFHVRINEILADLSSNPNEQKKSRRTICLSSDAKIELNNFYRRVEQEIANNYQHNTVKSTLMKLPENALRIAALLQYFHNREATVISTDNLACAIELASYYSDRTVALFWTEFATTEQDAEVVYAWLRKTLRKPDVFGGLFNEPNKSVVNNFDEAMEHSIERSECIKRADIQRKIGSRPLRKDGNRLNKALKRLEEESKITVRRERNSNGRMSEYIYLQI